MFAVVMHEADLLLGLTATLACLSLQRGDRHRVNSNRVRRGQRFFFLKEMSSDSLIGFIDIGLKTNQ